MDLILQSYTTISFFAPQVANMIVNGALALEKGGADEACVTTDPATVYLIHLLHWVVFLY